VSSPYDVYLPTRQLLGSTSFTTLTDTPATYVGAAGQTPAVVSTEDGVAFLTNRTAPYNYTINGDFQIWQRGPSITFTFGFGPYGFFTADQWELAPGGGNMVVSRQEFTTTQTDVPGTPRYYMETNVTSTAGASTIDMSQRIEGLHQFAGKDVILSFWVRTPDYATTMYSAIEYDYDSVDGTDETTQENVLAQNTWTKVTQLLSVSDFAGKTLGQHAFLNITPWRMDTALENPLLTGKVEMTGVQLEVNSSGLSSAYPTRPFAVELARCQRYYTKTFNYAVAPAHNEGTDGALTSHHGPVQIRSEVWNFPVTMYAPPGIQVYNIGTYPGTPQWDSGSDRIEAVQLYVGESNVTFGSVTAGLANTTYSLHLGAFAQIRTQAEIDS